MRIGYPPAQNAYGWCFKVGKEVKKDAYEAARWFRRAAKQDDMRAQYNLAMCYENGEGVIADIEKAFYWHMLSAAQGDDRAQLHVCAGAYA